MPERYPIPPRIKRTSDGSTNYDVETERVEDGWMWEVEHIACEDETSAFTSLRIGVRRNGSLDWLEEQKSPAAATLYWRKNTLRLWEGESIVVRFTGTTSGDLLAAYFWGEKKRLR